MGYDRQRTSYRSYVHTRTALLQGQLLKTREDINRISYLLSSSSSSTAGTSSKTPSPSERQEELDVLKKREDLLVSKISELKGQEQEELLVSPLPDASQLLPELVPIFICDACSSDILFRSLRYHCSECEDFDLCPSCFQTYHASPPSSPPSTLPPKMLQHLSLHHSSSTLYPETSHISVEIARISRATSVAQAFHLAFTSFAPRPCLGFLPPASPDHFEWLTYQQILTRVTSLSLGLSSLLNLSPRTAIAICGGNSVEWFLADLASIFRSLLVVPLHIPPLPDLSSSIPLASSFADVIAIINHCEIRAVFVGAYPSNLLPHFIALLNQSLCPSLQYIISLDSTIVASASTPKFLVTLHQLEEYGRAHTKEKSDEYWIAPASPDDLVTLVHTSGSTGTPKGAMMTDKIWRGMILLSPGEKYDPYVTVSKDPLAHISDREAVHTTLCGGGRIGICGPERKQFLFEDLGVLQPSVISSTPRFWNHLYAEFQRNFQESLKLHPVCDILERDEVRQKILEKFRGMFGKRLRSVGTGGAPTSEEVLGWLKECYRPVVPDVTDGYGCTEAGTIAGGDGVLSSRVQFRLVDVPDAGYLSTDRPFPRGELWVKTPDTIQGYYKNAEETKNGFTEDGWFRTGDVVELVETRRIKIIDRIKNIFKLSQGEFVTPDRIEAVMNQCHSVEQILIMGGSVTKFPEQNAVVAVVVPKKTEEKVEKKVRTQEILKELVECGVRNRLKAYEIPWAVIVEEEQTWTVENGFLTASKKSGTGETTPTLSRFRRSRS